jgi:small acid-soluble spore protein D (minor alpha/beta-type SASP)
MAIRILVPGSVGKLEKFKMEVAEDMGLFNNESKNAYTGEVPSGNVNNIKNSGNVGGEMVRRMVEAAEKNMVDNNKLT